MAIRHRTPSAGRVWHDLACDMTLVCPENCVAQPPRASCTGSRRHCCSTPGPKGRRARARTPPRPAPRDPRGASRRSARSTRHRPLRRSGPPAHRDDRSACAEHDLCGEQRAVATPMPLREPVMATTLSRPETERSRTTTPCMTPADDLPDVTSVGGLPPLFLEHVPRLVSESHTPLVLEPDARIAR